jgi:hypothetical protein
MGAHPNCESIYLMISDGNEYVPFTRYLKDSPIDAARSLIEAERKLARRVKALDAGKFGRLLERAELKDQALYLMGVLAVAGVLKRHMRIGPLLKGKGLAKFYHGLTAALQLAFGRKSRTVLERHTTMQGVLEVLALPLEDPTNIESDRMERCPSVFTYYDPKKDQVRTVPFCAWNTMHRKTALREIAEYYGTAQQKVPAERRFPVRCEA